MFLVMNNEIHTNYTVRVDYLWSEVTVLCCYGVIYIVSGTLKSTWPITSKLNILGPALFSIVKYKHFLAAAIIPDGQNLSK